MSITTRKILTFIGCLALPLAVGGVAGFFTANNVHTWYTTLRQPSFNPPNSVFAPGWTSLYILMGITLFVILQQQDSNDRRTAIITFGVQLFLNFWWSIIFFQFHQLGIALAEIVMLWLAIITMMIAVIRVKPWAGYLQLPYLAWVSFATILNGAYWWLNR